MVLRLRLLLAVAVLPLLLVVTGPAAPGAAATAYGSPVDSSTLTFVTEDAAGGNGINCKVTGYWAVAPGAGPGTPAVARTIVSKASCNTGFNISSAVLTLTATGPSCTLSGSPGEMDGNGWVSFIFGGTGCTASGSVSITEVCGSIHADVHAGIGLENDFTVTACANWNLGVPPDAPAAGQSCQYATITTAPGVGPTPRQEWFAGPDGSGNRWDFQSYKSPGLSSGALSNAGSSWMMYAVVQWGSTAAGGVTNIVKFATNTKSNLARDQHQFPVTTFPQAGVVDGAGVSEKRGAAGDSHSDFFIIGMGIVRVNSVNPSYIADSPTAWASADRGMIGKTNPALCAFYWGETIYDDPASNFDVPVGPLTPLGSDPDVPPDFPDPEGPESPDPGGCDFSFTDPSTWAAGGICALVGLLNRLLQKMTSLVNAVLGLPGAIWDAMRNGLENLLEALFVPNEDFLDDKFDDASDMLDESDVGAYRDAALTVTGSGAAVGGGSPFTWSFPGASLSAGSACSGPSITWTMVSPTPFSPLSACTAPMSTIAGYFRSFALLLVAIGGLFKGLGIVTSAMGVTKAEKEPWRPTAVGDI